MRSFFCLFLAWVCGAMFATLPHAEAAPKRFRRALVIAGGGISPGAALGILAGARAEGFEPDVILTTCGASLGVAVHRSFDRPADALDFARSRAFHGALKSRIWIDSFWAPSLKSKLDDVRPGVLPPLFRGNILSVPETVEGLLPVESFPRRNGPRLVVLAAKALFGEGDEGRPSRGPWFRQVFFTDPDTATALRGIPSTVKKLFPESRVDSRTEVITGVSLAQAARASISDPYYLNPARIGRDHYFTGAIDLFPIETAQAIADEVVVTYPSGVYSAYEDLAISSTFGFNQSERAKFAATHENVKWIDAAGLNALGFDPVVKGPLLLNNFPNAYAAYLNGVDAQYAFGYERAVEAMRAQKKRKNVRTHLRHWVLGNR